MKFVLVTENEYVLMLTVNIKQIYVQVPYYSPNVLVKYSLKLLIECILLQFEFIIIN